MTEITRLYYSDTSPYARICRMALRERGMTGAVHEVTTTLRDPAADVRAHNPVRSVPALVLPDGTTLTETTLVLGWLDAAYLVLAATLGYAERRHGHLGGVSPEAFERARA